MDNTSYHQHFHDTSYSLQNDHMYIQPTSNVLYQNYNERPMYGHFYTSQSTGYHLGSFNGQSLSNNPNKLENMNGIHSFNHTKPLKSPMVSIHFHSYKNTSNKYIQKSPPKNKNLGKVVINSDMNLSSSTEDLLSLAGRTHLKANSQINESMNELPVISLSSNEPRINTLNTTFQNENKIKYDLNQDTKPQEKKVLCRYYLQGHCNKGDKCLYIHSDSTTATEETTPRKMEKNNSLPSKFAFSKIEDCIGKIYQMSKDQHGCRFLQKKLDEDQTPKTCSIIFLEIHDYMTELMSGPFGNYLCQKLIEKCSQEQRIAILEKISDNLVLISRNIHGTRAVQKAIESINSREEIKIVRKALKGSVVPLIQDLNGNHVIQKCINTMEPNDKQFIYDAVAQHCVQVATHKHGCCVMQRCIDYASHEQRMQLIEEIKEHALELVQDAFGNYVVQYCLDLGMEDVCEKITIKLLGHIGYLSTQKFSSNVVEKCLKVGNSKTVQMISKELSELSADDPSFQYSKDDPLIQLLQHPFGNYVVQTALQVSAVKATNEWHLLADRIRPHLSSIKSSHYLKKIHTLLSQGPKRK